MMPAVDFAVSAWEPLHLWSVYERGSIAEPLNPATQQLQEPLATKTVDLCF